MATITAIGNSSRSEADHTPRVLAVAPPAPSRPFHASAAALGGRNDFAKATTRKLKHWTEHQSKKAKKRYKRKQELLAKAKPPPPVDQTKYRRALMVVNSDRSVEKRQQRMVIDALRVQRPPTLSPRQGEYRDGCVSVQPLSAVSHTAATNG